MSFISSSPTAARDDYIVLQGNLKKLKTNKRRYFVLFRECRDAEQPSRLDYYENEKKFRQKGAIPKRSIVLRSCFHIGQRRDTKHKHVISLYTKDDCFCLLLDSEVDLRRWLKAMLDLHSHEFVGVKRKAIDHVWHVQVQRKGLAEEHSITGAYHLCLTSQAVSLVRVGPDTVPGGELRRESIEFPLVAIRRCGDSQCFFYMEVGRFSCIGQGELWMGTEAPLIAQNMHSTIMHAMAVCKTNEDRDEFGPVPRGRSSSANEASKPISLMHRRQTHVGGGVGVIGGINSKPMHFSPVSDDLGEASFASHDVGPRRMAPHQPDLLPPDVPSSPLSASTLSGSGSTVIQLDLYKLPELPVGRTSTPLKVVVPARHGPKHGFHVATTGVAVDADDHFGGGADNDDDDDDDDDFDDVGHDVADDNLYMLHVPMRHDDAATPMPAPTSADNGTGYVECFPASAGGGGGSVHAACLGRPSNATHSGANNGPPFAATTPTAPISYHHQRALSLPISAPPPLLMSATSAISSAAFATSNGTNTPFTTISSSPFAAGAATTAASICSATSVANSNATNTSSASAAVADEPSHVVGQFHSPHPLIVAQHQHQHHHHHHNSNTMHNHHHNNHHHHLNHHHQHPQQQQQQHHPTTTSTAAASSSSSASPAISKVTLPLHHSLKPFHQRTRSLPLTEETAIEIHTYHNDDDNHQHQQQQQQQLDNRPFHHGHGHVRAVSTDQTNNNHHHHHNYNHNHNSLNNNQQQQRRTSVDRGLLLQVPRIVVPPQPLTIGGDGSSNDGATMANEQLTAPVATHRGAEMPAASSVLRQLLASIDVAQLNGSNADMLKLLTAGSCGLNNNTSSSSTTNNNNNNNIGGGGSGATISSSAAAKRSKRGSGGSGSALLLLSPPTTTSPLGSNQYHLHPHHPRQRSMPSTVSACAGCVVAGDCGVISGGGGGGGGGDGRGQGNQGCGGGGGVCLSLRNATGRERCDSLPSRARTVSDTTTNAAVAAAAAAAAAESAAMPPPPPRIGMQQRPHSLYQQAAMLRHSSSPPMGLGGGALSPSMLMGGGGGSSGGVGGSGCSESDGSSLSIDETDGYNSHSMTPDESHQFSSRYFSSRTSGSVIPEENGDECWPTPTASSSPQVIATNATLANAVVAQHLMHHHHSSLHQHLHQHQLHQQNGGGGGSLSSSAASASAQSAAQLLASALHKSSPSGTSLMGRFSPCGSSPGDNQISAGAYMLMSPREENKSLYTNSSGASSLAEDLYVPNDPPPMLHHGEEYMDMMEQRNSRLSNNPGTGVRGGGGCSGVGGNVGGTGGGSHHNHDTCGGGSGMNSVASSCSITSGTPSTDLRFGEYQLDKVISIFTPDEEDPSLQAMDRPTRAYSVGSRLEHNKRKLAMEHRMPGDPPSSQSSSSSVSGSNQQQQQPLSAQQQHLHHHQQKQPSSRLRAFSVGAKVPRSDSYRGVVIQKAPLSTVFMKKDSNGFASSTSSNSSNVSAGLNNNPQQPHQPHHHQKSASVSMLHTYREQHLLQQQQLQLQQLQHELPAPFASEAAAILAAGKSSLPKTDAMDDLMEIDFTSSSTASSSGAGAGVCAMDEDGCGDVAMHSSNGPAVSHLGAGSLSGSPLVKSQPMSVPMARKLGDDHHPGHQLHLQHQPLPLQQHHHQPHHLHHSSGGSRGIDPPNGYVPMRPTLKTAASSLESATTMAMPMPTLPSVAPSTAPHPHPHPQQMASSTGSTGSMNSASFGNANPYMCMKPVGSSSSGAGSASNPQPNRTIIAATTAPSHQSPGAHSFALAQHQQHQQLHGSPKSVSGLAEVMRNAANQRVASSQSAANSDYLPMSPSQEHGATRLSASPAAARLLATTPTTSTLSPMTTPTTPTMPMSPPILAQQSQQQTSAPEGYMEMKFVRPTSNVNNNDSSSAHRSSATTSTIPRLSSQPINIAQPARKSTDHTSSNNPEAAAQRKHIGSLSLAVKSRVRCDSKDSGIVTPTGTSAHSAIFPFSPSSPKAGSMDEARAAALAMATTTATAAASRKCMIDATNGTVHLVAAGSSSSGSSNLKSASVMAEFGRAPPSEHPKVQNKDATPMQVDTLSNDYADMTLDVKPQQQQPAFASATASASVSAAHQPPIALMPATFPLAMPPAQAHAPPTTPNVRKTSNLQRPQLQLSSARETTNADYTLMKPSYPYPKKKPLLVQINNNLTNATSKTNATAFRPIAAIGQPEPLLPAAIRMQTSPPQTPTTPQPPTAAASPSPSTTGGSSSNSSNGPYELLLMRPNSVAQDKVVVKQLNTPLARSSSANSDRLLLSPSCRSSSQTSSSNSTSSSSSSSQTITAPSASTSLSAAAVTTAATISQSSSQSSSSLSSSTVRPASVASATASAMADESSSGGAANSSRPPSVSSERELYYASLDLPAQTATAAATTTSTSLASALLVASSSENEDDDGSYATLTPPPKAGATASADTATATATSIVNSSAETTPPPAAMNGFCYAQIDFVKSSEQIKSGSNDAEPTTADAAATATTAAAAATAAPTTAAPATSKVDGGLPK